MHEHTFKPDRAHFLAIIIMTLIGLLVISWAPLKLGWLLIIPLLAIWWVLRASTRVSEEGIDITYAFRGAHHVSWEEFDGIGFKGAKAFARTHDGSQKTLPGVTFNSLPKLAAASRGRIPDALTAGKDAADDKVVVIHRDGQQVLLTKEEFAQYQREHPNTQVIEQSPTTEKPEA